MKAKFTIAGTTYEFKEITLRTYYELQELMHTESKENSYKIVEALTGCPPKALRKLTFEDWLLIWDEAVFRITQMNGNADSIQPVVTINGVKYSLPKVDKMTIGEFADLDIITSEGNEKNLAKIASILYRPVVKETKQGIEIEDYDPESSASREEEFKDLPLWAIKSANSFFLRYVNSSLKNTADSLMKSEVMKNLSPEDRELYQTLLQPEPGGTYSIPLLEKTLSDFLKRHDSHSVQRLTGYPGERIKSKRNLWHSVKKVFNR